jgi:catechol 2,3-dioxygenase-like lactoylglutathione lyase family enzyme
MIRKERFMGTRLTHIALHVDAMDACIEFYQRYCDLEITNDQVRGGRRVVLMAEPGRGANFVLQLLAGGADKAATPEDDRHLGFAVDSRKEVDRLAAMAAEDGILLFDIFEAAFPLGYLCGIKDPNGNTVEISCGHLLESEAHRR